LNSVGLQKLPQDFTGFHEQRLRHSNLLIFHGLRLRLRLRLWLRINGLRAEAED
jgi:hypothetical protein